jgi:hypothetical protein
MVTCGQTDRHDEASSLFFFRDFANTPEVLLVAGVAGDRSLKLVDDLQVQHADEIITGLFLSAALKIVSL